MIIFSFFGRRFERKIEACVVIALLDRDVFAFINETERTEVTNRLGSGKKRYVNGFRG